MSIGLANADDNGSFQETDRSGDQQVNDCGARTADSPAEARPPNDASVAQRVLLPHHRQHLYASGLTDDTIAAAGVYSVVDRGSLADILGWQSAPQRMVPASVFPFQRLDGSCNYSRVKPDQPRICNGKPVKYESPRGRANEAYFPPNAVERLQDPDQVILITEGEKKALALYQHGYAAIGLVGVFGWKLGRREELLPELEHLPWQGRQVLIVFDSDVGQNSNVQDAETRLAFHLAQRRAHVRVVRLPEGPPDEQGRPRKIGADDFLVQHGIDAFRELLADAQEPAEPTALQIKRPANTIDPYEEIQAFLALDEQDGLSRLRFWRGSWYEHQEGHYVERGNDQVQGRLVRHLNSSTRELTTGIINNHVMQLRAQVYLDDVVAPPSWLGEPPAPWPADEVLPCRNQLIHLPSLVVNDDYARHATPRFFCPVALDFDFSPGAPCPTQWLDFLNSLWPDDFASIRALQEWFGYCLTLDTRQQKILLLIGPPRSGKGTIARVLRRLVGEGNAAGPTLASLGERFGLWPLLGKSVAIIADARLGRENSTVVVERLLSISGEDALTVDRKNLPPVTCKLDARFLMLSNELPHFSDASGALAGRMILLRLSESWLGRENHNLFDSLIPELPGILLWAIEGWRRLREREHFRMPEASQNMLQELQDLASPVGAFVRQCCEVGLHLSVSRDELYNRYRTWCQNDNGSHAKTKAVFGRDLRAVVPRIGGRQRHDGVRVYTGIALNPPGGPGGATGATGTQQAAQQANFDVSR